MAAPTTSYDVYSGDDTTLAVPLTATQTDGIILSAINRNGIDESWATLTGCVVEISQEIEGEKRVELMGIGGGTVNSDSTVTLTAADIGRGGSRTGTGFVFSGTGQKFNVGARVRLIVHHGLLNRKANIDRANSWSASQTIANLFKWIFGASTNWIRGDGNDLKFKDANNSETTLSQLTSLSGADHKVYISATDATTGFPLGKMPAGNGITMTQGNIGGNETLTPSVNLATDPGLEFSSGGVRVKTKTNGGITRDSNGLSLTRIGMGSVSGSIATGGGGDGALSVTSGTTTLDPTDTKEYTSLSVSAGAVLTHSTAGQVLMIKTTGDATINGTLDLNSLGGAGGAQVTGSNTGIDGATLAPFGPGPGKKGLNGTNATGGGGGGGGIANGVQGSSGDGAGGLGGVRGDASEGLMALLTGMAMCGAGGGSGGGDNAGGHTGAAGGIGGGGCFMYVGGNLTLGSSSIIRANGAAGSNANASTGGSGGGGGGGIIVIIVAGTITNNGATLTASGGAGGSTGHTGGAGGAGKVLIYSLADGTLITS